jgi:dTDP-4-amino-4,6-dideoxygalactose transaminase
VQGGLAVINNPQLFDKADSMYLNIEDQTDEQASYNARYIRLWSIIKKYYFTPLLPFPKRITLGKVLVLLYRKLHLIKQQATKELEKSPAINRLSDIQSTLLLNQIEKCERFNEHRKEVAQIYSEELNDGLLKQSNGNPLLRYPILVDNPSELLRELRNRKYICGRWYNSIVFPLKQNMVEGVGYVSGSCPNAEVITKKIINLPTSVDMGIEDAKEISKIVNTFGKPFKFNNLENHA